MERRTFLSLATKAVAIPVLGQGVAMGTEAGQVQMVPAGEDFEGVKRLMGFSRLTIKVGAEQTLGGLFVIEQHFVKKGGPPRHMHPSQDEWFYVMEGEFVFEIGEPGKAKRTTMSAGDSVLAPRGLPHVFSFISENPGRTLVAFTPAEKIEAFFRKVSVEGAPVPLTKELLEQYGMVFVGPPLSI